MTSTKRRTGQAPGECNAFQPFLTMYDREFEVTDNSFKSREWEEREAALKQRERSHNNNQVKGLVA